METENKECLIEDLVAELLLLPDDYLAYFLGKIRLFHLQPIPSILLKFHRIIEQVPSETLQLFRQELQKLLPTEHSTVTWKLSGAVFEEELDFLNSTFLQVDQVGVSSEEMSIAQILEKILIQTKPNEITLIETELDRILKESQSPYELRFSPCVLIKEQTHFLHFNLIGKLIPSPNYVV